MRILLTRYGKPGSNVRFRQKLKGGQSRTHNTTDTTEAVDSNLNTIVRIEPFLNSHLPGCRTLGAIVWMSVESGVAVSKAPIRKAQGYGSIGLVMGTAMEGMRSTYLLGIEVYLVDVRIEGWLKGKGERRREKSNGGEEEENMGNKCWTDATTLSHPPTHTGRTDGAKLPGASQMRRATHRMGRLSAVFPVCAVGQLLSSLSGFIHRAKQERHDIWDCYSCRMGQSACYISIKPGTRSLRGTLS